MAKLFMLLISTIIWSTISFSCSAKRHKVNKVFAYRRRSGCYGTEKPCDDGRCIQSSYFCDSWVDCSKGEDDLGCGSCAKDEFMCSNESCIPSEKICDGTGDCSDDSDERGCSNYKPVNCSDGSSISRNALCDAYMHCSDGGDEFGCTPCNDDEFRCSNKTCIPEVNICDGKDDCNNGEDEDQCYMYKVFKCSDGSKVPRFKVCDSIVNCPFGEDEAGCGSCTDDEFRCKDGKTCISKDKLCNQHNDCNDGSDENFDSCEKLRFKCNNAVDIPGSDVCNHVIQCPNAEDELGCGGCSADQFKCPDGSCISEDKICNGVNDCGNETSDEDNCYSYVCKGRYKCMYGKCIDYSQVCDSKIDCSYGSDEFGCGCPDYHFKCGSGECLGGYFVCDGGQNKDCRDGSDEISCGESLTKRKLNNQELKRKEFRILKEKSNNKNQINEEKQKERRAKIIQKIRELEKLDTELEDDY